MIEIVPAMMIHALEMAPRMRQQDKDEVKASGGYTPLEALRLSVENSKNGFAWAALEDGSPFVMWGAAAHVNDSGLGVVWLLATDHIYSIKRRFWRESSRYVSIMHERFDVLANYVDARNTVSMRWLEALGFRSVATDHNFGHERRPFNLYARYR